MTDFDDLPNDEEEAQALGFGTPTTKQTNKKVRQPLTAKDTKGRLDAKQIRRALGRQPRLDATQYQEAHPDKAVFWVNDQNGDVEKWLYDIGASYVPEFKHNIRDKTDSHSSHVHRWVGSDQYGRPMRAFLLMLDKETYQQILDADKEHRYELMRSMGVMAANGEVPSEVQSELNAPGSPFVQTYAPMDLQVNPDSITRTLKQISST